MKEINENSIYNLPFHDSSYLGLEVCQDDNGNTDVILTISFCEDEFDDFGEYVEDINLDGTTCLLFNNCETININSFCNRTQRDTIDYIEYNKNSSNKNEKFTMNKMKFIKVVFTSGSKLECVAEKLLLMNRR